MGILLIIAPFILFNGQLYGALLAILGGVITLFYNTATYRLTSKIQITASQTIAIRFWILFIILILTTGKNLNTHLLTFITIEKIFVLAFLSFILQIWLAQKGVFAIGVKYHGIILSLTPLATLILQGSILHQWYWNLLALTLIAPFTLNDLLWSCCKTYVKIFASQIYFIFAVKSEVPINNKKE